MYTCISIALLHVYQIRRCDDVLLSIKVTDTMSRVPVVLLTFVTGKVHCYQGML